MGAFSKFMGIAFATLLAKPFKDWKAFEYGLIDEKGNITKKKPNNQFERDSLGGIKNFVRKVKRLLIKVVSDSRALGALVSAILLTRESTAGLDEESQKVKDFLEKNMTENEIDVMIGYIKEGVKAKYI